MKRLSSTKAAPPDGLATIPKTILVVEDDRAVLNLVHMILEDGGYHVLSANSADAGLCIGLEFLYPIHLLLADVMLPGMRGDELASKIKEMRPSMRVILMSGKADGELAVLAGGWQFLKKPFVAAALLERVQAALGVRGASG